MCLGRYSAVIEYIIQQFLKKSKDFNGIYPENF